MTPLNKLMLFFLLGLFIGAQKIAVAAPLPAVEKVIQQGFPSQADALLNTSNHLFDEYHSEKNITSLIFYAYAMLRLANHFEAVNDYVNASEYAKLGFFYLDEAVDSHEENLRVRYLRARIDAFLPAGLGRCVVTLNDTDILLKQSDEFDADILAQINYMRYRALSSCKENAGADALLKQMKNGSATQLRLLALGADSTPAWDLDEVSQILMPLVKGE